MLVHLRLSFNTIADMKFVDRIENEDSNIEGIEFISAQHIGPRALVIGKNNYNILVCRSLIDLKYTFKTNLITL